MDGRRPNLLYIFTDQQRADTMRCYGNGQIRTPSLDALAEESFVFDNAYVSQPVCSPSRATMMTGLWPHTCGVPSCNVPLPAEVPTIAEHLSDDYSTLVPSIYSGFRPVFSRPLGRITI